MATINIPQTTLITEQFWPSASTSVTAPSPVSRFNITIDRTVVGGLNSLPASASLTIAQMISRDGGATFVEFSSSTAPGGVLHGDHGELVTTLSETVNYNPPMPAGTKYRWHTSLVGAASCVIVGSCTIA